MMLKKIMIVLFILFFAWSNANATEFDTLQQYLKREVNKNTVKATTSKSSNSSYNKSSDINSISEYTIRNGYLSYTSSWDDDSQIGEKLSMINSDLQSQCLIITEDKVPLVVDFRLLFKQSQLKSVLITKSTGNKTLDNEISKRIKKFFTAKNYGVLNNGNPFYFNASLATIPKETFSPAYLIDDVEMNTIPEENREYFKKMNDLFDEKFKNKANVTEEVLFLIKINKQGELLSLNQSELISEFNKLYSLNVQIPEISEKMEKELVEITNEIMPLEPFVSEYDKVLVMKTFKATKTPFIKPTDKVITKIGKGALVGLGYIVAIPFVIIGAVLGL